MPELPEVEVLVRHLKPRVQGKTVRRVWVNRAKVLGPTSSRRFAQSVSGARFCGLTRRGKYLLFTLRAGRPGEPFTLLGHLGMTGRMYVLPSKALLPKHAAVIFNLGRENFIFEDTRYFGRLTLDTKPLLKLGPEPLGSAFTPEKFAAALGRSRQSIKVKLLDQSVLAGIGNIYASEALFRAGVAPTLPACALGARQVVRLWRAIREVLSQAIAGGSTVPLDYSGSEGQDRTFYFGRAGRRRVSYEERLQVYGRAGQPCSKCGAVIQRMVQAGRSTYFCARCQPRKLPPG